MSEFKVYLVAEDGEYVLSEHQTYEAALAKADRIESHYGDGQYLEIREHRPIDLHDWGFEDHDL